MIFFSLSKKNIVGQILIYIILEEEQKKYRRFFFCEEINRFIYR